MKTIRWGIIGLGKIANKFAKDLQTIDHCELYGVASRHQEKANSFAKQYNATKAYDCYEALAADPNIDAIYIATPHSYHKEHAIMCMNYKKAVLCEKPLALNLKDVEAMIASAKQNNVLFMEALWTYFLPHYQFVLNELKSNKYGAIRKLEADFGFQPTIDMESRVFKKSLGGGSLLDIGIYPIFAALSTLGQPVDIEAKATFFDNGADATCDVIFNYNNGVKAFLKSTLLEETPTEALFQCEHGTIKINTRFHQPSTVTTTLKGSTKTHDFDYKTIGYNYETEHFNALLRNNALESPIMTHNFSRTLMFILDDVRHLINLKYD
ncbi:Gfo/Idh/MocA family oxidoreductase [Gelidibacter salicanalis]|uniref:Gfo/Idh/MocA family oxidoreductase n=1 Tax=Gelidibacter salicanalis TaxID=291193 RepID=A0A5C7AT85_9FLAO|nr:Gfo/Idh/MocA family oxidoreductase [Gelidibacter salicanalis]TXE10803.1 Gfo/Idh/MocA family oxidoreductase [Gelidibacter salicanalis]